MKLDVRTASLAYQRGFGNEFASEAIPGALPRGQNSPQQPPLGLYAEQLSGTAFTAPRGANRRSWLYRIRPSAAHPPYREIANAALATAPLDAAASTPNRLRWDPQPFPNEPTDFIEGLATIAASGDAARHAGVAAHTYVANRSMRGRVLCNADGELLVVPETGALLLFTEFGRVGVAPGEIAVVPRGVRFRVELLDATARGYVCENYGAFFRLPDLGPIGANGLANPRDFASPCAAFEDDDEPTEIVLKFRGRLWSTTLDHSPLDVVAWHGNYAPYTYDLACFNAMNTVGFDHPDPSIFTVLTSPSEIAGTANADFVLFPPRWMVAEHTFRPPWFHRNVMSEYMGLIHGVYDAKAAGFLPGGGSLHNCMSAHGPDAATHERASRAVLEPVKLENTLAFMFESRFIFDPAPHALASPMLQNDYDAQWDGLPKTFRDPAI